MYSKQNVVIDLDNTLNNLCVFLYDVAKYYRQDIPYYTEWDNYYTLNKFFDEETVDLIIHTAIIMHDMSYGKPTNNTLELLNFFKKNKIMIKIVTLRNDIQSTLLENWLQYYKIPYDFLVLAKNKTNYINENTILYIDDAPHLIEQCLQYTKNKNYSCKCVLFAQHLYAAQSNIDGSYKISNLIDALSLIE